jgi:hypothetical protein
METAGENRCDIAVALGDSAEARDSRLGGYARPVLTEQDALTP